jgi:hypothetical protein
VCNNRGVKPAIALVIAMGLAPVLLADRRHVVSDDKVDFAGLKTFSLRDGDANTTRPELNNPLVFKKTADAIRAQLSAKGLTESPIRPDALVGFTIGADRPNGPSVIFDQGTLVIDVTVRETNRMVWHGVYTDDRSTPAKVAEKLPAMVQKLLAGYPPRKKK